MKAKQIRRRRAKKILRQALYHFIRAKKLAGTPKGDWHSEANYCWLRALTIGELHRYERKSKYLKIVKSL